MDSRQEKDVYKAIIKVSRHLIWVALLTVAMFVITIGSLFYKGGKSTGPSAAPPPGPPITITQQVNNGRPLPTGAWQMPKAQTIPPGKEGEMIRYGRDLIVSTAKYFGPEGSIAHISNGLNCQNCHLDAGTRPFGNNFSGFMAAYPKKSARSGSVEPASERLIECFERSLNGKAPDTNGKEIRSILAYMKWVGKDVQKGRKPIGNTAERLSYMDRAADPVKGKIVFVQKCQSCHGANGEGKPDADKVGYTYPPLWGPHSYNDGAGMYRISNFADFVKDDMPFGASYAHPQLSDEEAWDVAAYVNSQPRPHKDQRKDYPDLKQKPIDLPFGPYVDHFTQTQHKYGPFKPIEQSRR